LLEEKRMLISNNETQKAVKDKDLEALIDEARAHNPFPFPQDIPKGRKNNEPFPFPSADE
jgi:hypothetical protein